MAVLIDEIAAYVREHFEDPHTVLTPEMELVATLGAADPGWFTDFLEGVSKRFGIRPPELNVVTLHAVKQPTGKLHSLFSSILGSRDVEVVSVPRLTLAELAEIVRQGIWPQHYVVPRSQASQSMS